CVAYSSLYAQVNLFFLAQISPSSICTLFPYTTLFRSRSLLCTIGRYAPARQGLGLCHCSACNFYAYFLPSFYLKKSLQLKNKSRSEEHTSELQSRFDLVCRLLLEKRNK